MFEKAKDPKVIAKKISYKPIDYEKLNRLTDDFGKRFTPQQELLAEQAFGLRISNPTIESSLPPVRVKIPSELPKVSLVNESLKKLKFQLAPFDSVVKKKTTHNALTEEYFEKIDLKAWLKHKDTTICKLKDTIKSLIKNNKEEIVYHDRCDLATINEELENSVAKLLFENERLCKEINHVKQVFKDQFDSIKQTCVLQKEQSDSLINKLNLKSAKHEDLKAQIQDKVFVITSLKNDLRKLKGKAIVDNVTQIPSATTVAPRMFKLDLEPLAPKLIVQIVLWYLDSGCSKHMTGNRSQLMNFVSKFLGTLRFENDQIARIMGYGDYQLGNVIISSVYYVEGLRHNLFFVGQFCDADLEVAFRKNTCFIRSSNSDTDKIMARMDAMTLKMNAQYKELQTHAKKIKPDLDEDDIPMSREEEAKFMQTFRSGKSYNPPINPNGQNNPENPINFDSDEEDEEPTPQSKTKNPKPVKETLLPNPYKPKISIDVNDETVEEDFDGLLDEGSKILHSTQGTLLEEEIFAEFDKSWQ
nr:integrase, catalytic region, zinc finger, CCHC-type, peptidase aspartic, catalytic [Tanacetum cinerariifolium]